MTMWRQMPGQEALEATYESMEAFLADMRAGTLKSEYRLSERTFLGLIEKVNQDAVFAREIMDHGVLLLMSTVSGDEIGGLMAMAEACCEGKSE